MLEKNRLLFTPNFAAKKEYEYALSLDCYLTIDSLYPFQYWPELLQNRSVLVRLDLGVGAGHHPHVLTAGDESKFGIALEDLNHLIDLAQKTKTKVIGLHAHAGSGILDTSWWPNTAQILTGLSAQFPQLSILNLGGGLGISDAKTGQSLDLNQMDLLLKESKAAHLKLAFWMEPGRFFVAESGVLLAAVTQIKYKADQHFIGLETGMNSLLRPSLYGAYHEIVNLSRFKEKPSQAVHVVGPICESADFLGRNRFLPETQEGDIFLIANAGAYGHCMSSSYNLRQPAQEIILS